MTKMTTMGKGLDPATALDNQPTPDTIAELFEKARRWRDIVNAIMDRCPEIYRGWERP